MLGSRAGWASDFFSSSYTTPKKEVRHEAAGDSREKESEEIRENTTISEETFERQMQGKLETGTVFFPVEEKNLRRVGRRVRIHLEAEDTVEEIFAVLVRFIDSSQQNFSGRMAPAEKEEHTHITRQDSRQHHQVRESSRDQL